MDFRLEVNGAVVHPLSLTLEALHEQYEACTVATYFQNEVRAVDTTFTGVRLWDILQSAEIEAKSSDNLRVQARASDQFRCILRWQELDSALTDRVILVAYAREGKPLSQEQGLLRLVIPGDEQGVRHLKNLALLTVLDRSSEEADEEA